MSDSAICRQSRCIANEKPAYQDRSHRSRVNNVYERFGPISPSKRGPLSSRTWPVMLRRTRSRAQAYGAASDFWLTQPTLSNNREKPSGPSEVSSVAAQRLHTDDAEDRLSMRGWPFCR
jgi:hypothetical protein